MTDYPMMDMIRTAWWFSKVVFKGNDYPHYTTDSFKDELMYFVIPRYGLYKNVKITYLDLKPPKESECIGTAVFFHGNWSDLGDYYMALKEYSRNIGLRILAMEYPGFGVSDRYPKGESHIVEWCKKFFDFVENVLNVPYEKLFVIGHSLGTGVCFHYVYEMYKSSGRIPLKLVLISGYTDVKDVIRDQAGRFLALLFASRFNILKRIDKIPNLSVAFIHGEVDTTIPSEHSKRLYNAYPYETKSLTIIHGADHSLPDPVYDVIYAITNVGVLRKREDAQSFKTPILQRYGLITNKEQERLSAVQKSLRQDSDGED